MRAFGCSNRLGVRHEGVHGEESEFPRPSFDRISKVAARVLGRACVDDGESGRVAFAESLCTRFAERRRFPVFRLRNRTDQFSASERDRKRKGSPAVRSKEKWPLDPACRGSRPWLENRASIGIVTTETRPLSFLLSSEQRRRWREMHDKFAFRPTNSHGF